MLRLVWPLPRSLATTDGISVDFSSSPYLDVSVQAVPHVWLFDSPYVDTVLPYRVSPFGNLRIEAYVQLPEAYRSLSRPSSAPDAKAFPLRSSALDLFDCLVLELCKLHKEIFSWLIVITLKKYPLLLPSHNFIIIQCSVFKVQSSLF